MVTALVWFRHRDRFAAWIAVVVAFTAVGIGGYVVFPATPPWLASRLGLIGSVHRVSDLGWDYLHLPAVGHLIGSGQAGSNATAAVPSLHAGSTLLVGLFLWPIASRSWRSVLVAYVALMAVTLVYTGEHYVLDVGAGWCTAVVANSVGGLTRSVAKVCRAPVWRTEYGALAPQSPTHPTRRNTHVHRRDRPAQRRPQADPEDLP